MVSNAFLTAAQPAVAGELQCPLGAIPAVPGKLELALLDAALRPGRHAAGVDEIGLGAEQQVRRGMAPPWHCILWVLLLWGLDGWRSMVQSAKLPRRLAFNCKEPVCHLTETRCTELKGCPGFGFPGVWQLPAAAGNAFSAVLGQRLSLLQEEGQMELLASSHVRSNVLASPGNGETLISPV